MYIAKERPSLLLAYSTGSALQLQRLVAWNKRHTHTHTHTHCPLLTSVLPGFTLPSRISRSDPCPTHSLGSGVFGTRSSPSSASFFADSPSTSAGGCQGVCVCVAKRYIPYMNISVQQQQPKILLLLSNPIIFRSWSPTKKGVENAMPGRQHTRLVPGPQSNSCPQSQLCNQGELETGNWKQQNLSLRGTQSGVHCCNRQCQMRLFWSGRSSLLCYQWVVSFPDYFAEK